MPNHVINIKNDKFKQTNVSVSFKNNSKILQTTLLSGEIKIKNDKFKQTNVSVSFKNNSKILQKTLLSEGMVVKTLEVCHFED
jgi:hypothetical protein